MTECFGAENEHRVCREKPRNQAMASHEEAEPSAKAIDSIDTDPAKSQLHGRKRQESFRKWEPQYRTPKPKKRILTQSRPLNKVPAVC